MSTIVFLLANLTYLLAARLKDEQDARNLEAAMARLGRDVRRADRELGSLFAPASAR